MWASEDGWCPSYYDWSPGWCPDYDAGTLGWGDPYSASASLSRTAVVRIGSLGKYPPVRTYYTLPGTDYGWLRALGSRLPRIVFPDGGGIGAFTWHGWIRRPQIPAKTTGTFIDITAGLSALRVALNVGGIITATVTDGTTTVAGNGPSPVVALQWMPIAVKYGTNVLTVYVDGVGVPLDTSSLTVPAIASGWSFTVGTKSDGTAPLDFDLQQPALWDLELTPGQVAALVPPGPNFDLRNPEPVTPTPSDYWIDPIVDGVVPNAVPWSVGGYKGPLIPFEGVVSYTEPGVINAWASGDHRLGVYSTAWFPESAQDPDLWPFAFVTSAHEDVFGECPRVVGVTVREDGAMLLDLDAKMAPGVDYTLTGPDDLTGVPP